MRSGLGSIAIAVALVFCLTVPSSVSAQLPGVNYGAADANNGPGDPGLDVTAPAFPGLKAFFMGTCDLTTASTGGTGVGAPPLVGPVHCIDHGQAYAPADALNPNPVRETTWEPGFEPDWRFDSASQAGGHPDVTLSLWVQRWPLSPQTTGSSHTIAPDGDTKDLIVKLPPGFLGNPNAVPQCAAEALRTSPPTCPPETQVGIATVTLGEGGVTQEGGSSPPSDQRVPIWNVEPRTGKLAEFMISANVNAVGRVNIPLVARARTDGDFGVDTLALNLPSGLPLLGQTITLWGVPWDASHDKYRPPTAYVAADQSGIPESGFPDSVGNEPQGYEPDWGPLRAFTANHTECDATDLPEFRIEMESWHVPGSIKSYTSPLLEPIEGCEDVGFDPSLEVTPSSTAADSATGLDAELEIPQNLDAPIPVPAPGASQPELDDYVDDATAYWRSTGGLWTSQLKDTVVTLPEGLTVNPSASAGLEGCSDAQLGVTQQGTSTSPPLFDNHDPFDSTLPASQRCPNGSKIGTVEAYSPVLPADPDDTPGDPNVTGDVVLGSPKPGDVGNSSQGIKTHLFLVVRNRERGLVAKISGIGDVDGQTGQITTTFAQNPRVPLESLRLRIKGGQRSALATAQRCLPVTPGDWSALLTPWTAAHGAGGEADTLTGVFGPTTGCSYGFSPTFAAGTDNPTGGGSGNFSFTLDRPDGQQWIRSLSSTLPTGVSAKVGSVPLCSSAQAATGNCPLSSKVGVLDAGAGAGQPFFLEKKGSVYLTEGYKGAPYGLSTVADVEAGPFRGQFALDRIVVRQALYVDRRTAQATVVSDPFPTIWHGIPLRMRKATLVVNRPGFTRNPTDCTAKSISTTFVSTEGATSTKSYPFQAKGCKNLKFSPKLSLRLTGRKQTKTNGHPGIKAQLTQPAGQAGIKKAQVRLPKALVLDIDNANAICEFKEGIKDEPNCPAGSIVGRATATSPLLSRPLTGNVYFVKNVRINEFGREIRTLPMIIIALRGEIAINLRGESDVKGGRLMSTFAAVPDAPVTKFNLDIAGGKSGILKITANRRGNINICRSKQTAISNMDGQNGRFYDRQITVKTPCKKTKKPKKRSKSKKR